jgi:hypothetical protein
MCPGFSINRLFRACLLLVLCASATLLFDKQAHAQCSARDVIRRHPNFTEQPSSSTTPKPTEPAAGTRVWKSIEVGTFATKTALYQALDDADCDIGDTAEEILVAQEFRLSGVAMKLNLVAISVNELDIARGNATLKNIYARARAFGFALAPADAGPQLRLQYFEQPMGEFLEIAMAPIKTRTGTDAIFSVVNGGAGLLLLGENIGDDAEYDPSSRFVFVRPIDVATHQ